MDRREIFIRAVAWIGIIACALAVGGTLAGLASAVGRTFGW